jgi:hemoglobin
MHKKRTIESKQDLEEMLTAFYTKAFKDDLIGRFFTEVVPLDLDHHIPIIASFWETVLFNTANYRGNVMEIHKHISQLSPIKKEHLDRWVQLFTQTVEEFFEGDKADLLKQRAATIAVIMDRKLSGNSLLG